MPRHVLTTEDRQKAFRNAVFAIQVRYGLDFNRAVQYVLRRSARKAGFDGDWQAYREARKNNNHGKGE
jgi:hypothetical protein